MDFLIFSSRLISIAIHRDTATFRKLSQSRKKEQIYPSQTKKRKRERAKERDGKKGTERRERINNLHSDESIVLRQAHATAPIMALRLVEAASTELLHSHPPRARVLHRPPPSHLTLSFSLSHPPMAPWLLTEIPRPFSPRTSSSRSLAHFSAKIPPFHCENFNYNRNYYSRKSFARRLTKPRQCGVLSTGYLPPTVDE